MATATRPQGTDGAILATIRKWTNPGRWSTLFTVAAEVAAERNHEAEAWRALRDAKYPRHRDDAVSPDVSARRRWENPQDDELPDVAEARRYAEQVRHTVHIFSREFEEMLAELAAIHSYLIDNAPALEYLVPLVRPGIAEPAESFEAMAERMVKLAGELAAAIGPLIETVHAAECGGTKRGKAVNERMQETLLKKPDSRDWTSQQWADELGCSTAAITTKETWKSLANLRAISEAEKAMNTGKAVNRRRKIRSKRHY